MFKTYFKTAFRNLLRHRKHAMLNIMGLAVAIAACIIVFLVIQYETSYEKHLKEYNNIYQVVTKDKDAEGEHFTVGIPFPVIKYLRADNPQYQFAELMQHYGVQVTVKPEGAAAPKKFIEETGVFYSDEELVKIFELQFLSGSPASLRDVNSVAISRMQAVKYFGDWKNAMGKIINIDNSAHNLQVAAIFEDVPPNSDFPFTLLASYEGYKAYNNSFDMNDWGTTTSNHQVYVKLPANANVAALNGQLAGLQKKYNDGLRSSTRTHFLQPIGNIHFDERFSTNGNHITSLSSIYTLAFIGLLIILMACINFVNLSTALAVTRSKEVGIRKVMGSSKAQLSLQVFIETSAVVLVAGIIGILLAWLALPYVKNIMVVQNQLHLFSASGILFILSIILVTILLSGIYPALVMGRFKPVEAIKNKINTSRVGSVPLRRVLVVLQFAFSQILIIATIIAVSQMNFIKNSNLGFNKDATLIVYMNADSTTRMRHDVLRDALKARSDVKELSFGFDAPSSQNVWSSDFAFDKTADRDFSVQLKLADENYANTYGLQMAAGRFYQHSDTVKEYVVNETLVKKCGFANPQDAIGKMMRLGGAPFKPVVGVVKDFKQATLKEAIEPIAFLPRTKSYQSVGIKLSTASFAKSNDEIKAIWDKLFPEYVYNASYLDENINRYYLAEQRLNAMYKVYALLAIFISCLGLYGLVSFMVVSKTKEVGIRKVLGASVQSILYLFSKEFTILIAIAFIIAVPAAWYLMDNWLKDFAYKIDMSIWFFVIAIVVSILVAWLTVGYKAMRAATANPVKSLRTE